MYMMKEDLGNDLSSAERDDRGSHGLVLLLLK